MVAFTETQQVASTYKVFLVVAFLIFLGLTSMVNQIFLIGVIISFVFLVISLVLRLDINIQEDTLDYRLYPFHKSKRIINTQAIESIDIIRPKQIGVFGFKIKSNLSETIYYLGGDNLIRIRTNLTKDIILGTRRMTEVQKLLNL